MKKALLFAVTALVSTAVSAQSSVQKVASPSAPAKPAIHKMVKSKPVVAPQGSLRMAVANRNLGTPRTFSAEELKSLKPVARKGTSTLKSMSLSSLPASLEQQWAKPAKPHLKAAPATSSITAQPLIKAARRAPFRVGALKTKYSATGTNITGVDENNQEVSSRISWDMTAATATLTDGTEVNVLVDVIPTPDDFKSNEDFANGIPYTYTVADNTLTIEPQYVATSTDGEGNSLDIYLFALDDNGPGAIKMNIGEDGALTTTGQSIIIGAFSSEEFPTDMDAFKNSFQFYYEYVYNIRYRYEGQALGSGNTDAIFKPSYDGTGRDYFQNRAKQTWTMYPSSGTFGENETPVNVLVDIIPVPDRFASYFPDGVPVRYTLNGNAITIEPQSIGLSYTNEAGDSTFVVSIFNATAEDGVIHMTISEDGTIESGYPWIAYGGLYNGLYELNDDDELETLDALFALTTDVSYNGFYGDVTLATEREYRAYGVEEGEALQWTMAMGTATQANKSTPVFINLIPTPEMFNEIYPDGIYVDYEQAGKVIKVPAQAIASTSSYTFFFCSDISDDGSIEMTIGDDGALELNADEEILIAAFSSEDFSWDAYEGMVSSVSHIRYLLPGQKLIPVASYEPEGLYLHIGYSPEGQGYYSNLAAVPADATVSFSNNMVDPADTFNWSVTPYGAEGPDASATITDNTYNFSFKTTAGDVYTPVALSASNEGETSEVFTWGHNATDREGNELVNEETGAPYVPYVYAGYLFNDEAEDGPLFVSKVNLYDNGYYIWPRYATPDKTQNSLSRLVLYQGKPAGPLYFEGINLQVNELTMNTDFNLTCKIQKVSRNATGRLNLGEVLAQADITAENVITSSDGTSLLQWQSFYTEDENGMTEDLDFLQIEDEFAIVIDGWDNGTFSCTSVLGDGYLPASSQVSTFFNITGNDENLYYFTSAPYIHLCVGYLGAVYGYLHTDDNTQLNMPAEGGSATIHVKPMLSGTDEETGENTTALWYADEDYVEPEWLHVEIANESYVSGDWGFDLQFTVDELPSDVNGRYEQLVFNQWGAKLVVTVQQGENQGVKTIENARPVKTNGKVYDLSGRQVKAMGKGLMVRDGKKVIVNK